MMMNRIEVLSAPIKAFNGADRLSVLLTEESEKGTVKKSFTILSPIFSVEAVYPVMKGSKKVGELVVTPKAGMFIRVRLNNKGEPMADDVSLNWLFNRLKSDNFKHFAPQGFELLWAAAHVTDGLRRDVATEPFTVPPLEQAKPSDWVEPVKLLLLDRALNPQLVQTFEEFIGLETGNLLPASEQTLDVEATTEEPTEEPTEETTEETTEEKVIAEIEAEIQPAKPPARKGRGRKAN